MNSQPPIITFGIVACTFSDNLSRNSCIKFKTWHDERAWGNRRNFASPLVPPNDVWGGTSAEIPYWWHVTTQIWVVLLIACVASVSNRVIARTLERKQKKVPRHSFFFAPVLSQLSRRTSRGNACYAGYASDWSCSERNLLQPIRSTIQIWVVTRHQYGISSFVSRVNQR